MPRSKNVVLEDPILFPKDQLISYIDSDIKMLNEIKTKLIKKYSPLGGSDESFEELYSLWNSFLESIPVINDQFNSVKDIRDSRKSEAA